MVSGQKELDTIDMTKRGREDRAEDFMSAVSARLGMSRAAANRATVMMFDQCFASATNFVVGVAVARIGGPAGLGAFALAYGGWIFINNQHRALITDPMAISGDMRESEKSESLERGFGAEIYLGLVFTVGFLALGSALVLLGQRTFGFGLVAVAPWVTFLDLQDYWRWIGFMEGRPGKALANDVVFAVVEAAAFGIVYTTGMHGVFAVVSAWGVGAAAGAIWGLRQFSVRPRLRGGIALLRKRWHMSKWLSGNQVTIWGTSQLYLIIAGAMLGPAALGGLKAAQALVSGPTGLVINAGGSIGLPEASRALANRGWEGLHRVCWWYSAAGLATVGPFAVVILFAGSTLMRVLYGPQFSQFAPEATIFAISLVLAALSLSAGLTLKAAKQTRALFSVHTITMIVSVPSVVVLSALFETKGAAGTLIVVYSVGMVVLFSYRRRAQLSFESPIIAPSLTLTEAGCATTSRSGLSCPQDRWLMAPTSVSTEAG